MSSATELVQAWHDQGDDDRHAIDNATETIVEMTILDYGLEPTEAQEAKLNALIREIVESSVDWTKISDADENAKADDEAWRDAIYSGVYRGLR